MKACPGFFIAVKSDGPKAESGGGVLEEGAATHLFTSKGVWGACELHSGVRGGSVTAQRFSTIFNTQVSLS